MEPLRFIDAGVTLGGRFEVPTDYTTATLDEVRRTMADCSVDGALLRHAAAREHEPLAGNRLLLEETDGDAAFSPVACLAPLLFPGDGGRDDDRKATAYLSEHRFCGVVMYPSAGEHNFSLSDWCAGPILSAMESMRMPLFLSLPEAGAEALAPVLENHPDLPVILEAYYAADRVIYPLLERHRRLHLLTINDRQYCGLEQIAARFGVKRLVFGSVFPASSMGASVASVLMSALSDEEKRQVASGTIEGLLKEIEYDS